MGASLLALAKSIYYFNQFIKYTVYNPPFRRVTYYFPSNHVFI